MKTKPQHTPTPQMEINGGKYNLDYISARLGCTKADAALIVRAVNNFDRLLDAAKNILDNADDMEESKNDDGKDWDDYAELRSAVVKAEKRS